MFWKNGRCFENAEGLVVVDKFADASLDMNAEQLRKKVYKEYFAYLRRLLEGRNIDDLWGWFFDRIYAEESIERTRKEIHDARSVECADWESTRKIGSRTAGVIRNALVLD